MIITWTMVSRQILQILVVFNSSFSFSISLRPGGLDLDVGSGTVSDFVSGGVTEMKQKDDYLILQCK